MVRHCQSNIPWTFALKISILFPLVSAAFQPLGVQFKSPVTVASGLSANVIYSNLTTPRGITLDGEQNILVVERGFGITVFNPTSVPLPGWNRTVVIQDVGFTQGIQIDDEKLYVSTSTTAFVYQYSAKNRSVSGTAPIPLVTGIPGDGDLTTHTLQLERDNAGHAVAILIANGPLTNIDPTARDPASGRSQIRRFLLPSINFSRPSTPLAWSTGQIIAFGIRNPAGFAFSNTLSSPAMLQTLLVVENGASIDGQSNFTSAFVNDNPADELELVTYFARGNSPAPKTYGFPDCTTLWNATADPVGNPQFVDKPRGFQFSLELDPARDDAFCGRVVNNEPPILNFQAHSVPLDIKFFEPPAVRTPNGLPDNLVGHAFVSFHGSFNRSPPTGYGVVHFPFPNLVARENELGYTFIVQATNLGTCPGSCIRPVGLAFGKDGRLFVTSDTSGELFVIEKSTL